MSNWSKEGAICPYCGHLTKPDDDHYGLYSEDTCEYTCSSCGEEFNVEVFTSYSWTTSAIEKDDAA